LCPQSQLLGHLLNVDVDIAGRMQREQLHGIVDNQEEAKITSQKIEAWVQYIEGIVYYIDKFNNILII
jgi:hypothetical protein